MKQCEAQMTVRFGYGATVVHINPVRSDISSLEHFLEGKHHTESA